MPLFPSDDSSLDFPELPPFPSSTVRTAPLVRLRLSKLVAGDAAEIGAMFAACRDRGFFYLDLRGSADESAPNGDSHDNDDDGDNGSIPNGDSHDDDDDDSVSGPALLELAEALFGVAPAVFALPLAEKQRYDFVAAGSYFGYKGLGQGIVDARGTRDANEFWNLAKDDLLGRTAPPLPNPPLLRDHEPTRALLARFVRRSHAVVRLLLAALEGSLRLPRGELLRRHRLAEPSGDQVRWVRAPPLPADDDSEAKMRLGAHTDFGSVTLLFNRLGGLQIPDPDRPAEWCYVRPLRGHAVVNLGDAMVKFTAGILRSSMHRVVRPPGDQASLTRWSLVYFNRPEDEVVLEPVAGSPMIDDAVRSASRDDDAAKPTNEAPMKAKDWILRRAMGRRVGGDFEKSAGTEQTVANGTK